MIPENIEQVIRQAYYRGSKVVIVGVGGTAELAEYFADALIGPAGLQARPLPALAVTSNVVRRVQALTAHYDVVLVISSGLSKEDELAGALDAAKAKSCSTVGLFGKKSVLIEKVEVPVIVPGRKESRIVQRQRRLIRVIIRTAQEMR